MAFPWLKVVSTLIFLIGAAVLIIGLVITPKYLPKYVDDKLNDYLIIDSNSSEQWVGWEYGADYKNPYYLVIYMWNLSNPGAVLAGETPSYTSHGPYMYRRYRSSVGVSFLGDGDYIQYSNYERYFYDQNTSGGLSDSDVYFNINPAYVGAMIESTVPGSEIEPEINMRMAAVGATVSTVVMEYLTGAFVSLFTSYQLPTYFIPAMDSAISAYNATNGGDMEAATEWFITQWATAITAPTIGNWNGLLLVSGPNSTSPNISIASATLLLNASVPLSLLHVADATAWTWDQAMTDSTAAQTLINTFQITPAQLALIWNWRLSIFGPDLMYPQVITEYGLTNISDIGWVQFSSQKALGGKPVHTAVGPGVSVYDIYATVEINSNAATWQEWKEIWNPTTGLTNITIWQEFVMYAAPYQGAAPGNYTPWGLSPAAAQTVFGYGFGMAQNELPPLLIAKMGPNGGLFVSKTVLEWTFNCNDYLLNLLRENPPPCAFRLNATVLPPNIISTGKQNLSEINMYTMWQGQEQVVGYQYPINVTGHSELGQFAPHNENKAPQSVFQEDLIRTIWLNYTGDTLVEGIDTYQYVIDFASTFGPNPLYYQFINGICNVTYFYQSPVFLSLWEMLYVPGANQMVQGLNPTNEFNDSTVIDIEPNTGKAIQSRKRLQVNVFMPNFTYQEGSNFGNANVTSDIFYPLVKLGEYATIAPDQAEDLKSKLALEPKIKNITFYAGVTAGPVLILLGIGLFALSMRKKHRYEEIGH
jgi:hypothetical protein